MNHDSEKTNKKKLLDELTGKEKHDIKNAILTLEIFSESLLNGYSFDDKHSKEKRKLIIEAIQTISQLVKK